MPYITSERVAEIRKQIKKEFPQFKFSIQRKHMSVVDVTILSGPLEMLCDEQEKTRGNVSVNYFYIKDHYKDYPEVRDILSRIYQIMNEGNKTISEDGDYGSVPAFYVNLEIGQWDKPYQVIKM